MPCLRCYVSGRVQGVFFRASTRNEAEQLGLTGYAHNLQDGRVEVLACGPRSQVEALASWLAKGPTHAQVSNVTCEPAADEPPSTFTID